ncbi:MAG: hypothetical protein SOT82_03680, partial [Oscillospiraceae bacterium]|nr:hypothetical protein [Oscillospiraceae bacterium]
GSFFCTNRCGMPPAAYFFLACQKKVCKKETLENEIALSRLKRHFDSAYHSPMARPEGRSDYGNETTKRTTERKAFQARSAISRPNGLFFHIFSAMTEKIWPAERR